MAKVTGIGGVFFRARDPQAVGEWYQRHLGIPYAHGFAKFSWSEDKDADASTIWCAFDEDTAYFGQSGQRAMINYRVDDIDKLVAKLQAEGVEIDPERTDDENGRFAWIVDCEGNRVELWEPPTRKKV